MDKREAYKKLAEMANEYNINMNNLDEFARKHDLPFGFATDGHAVAHPIEDWTESTDSYESEWAGSALCW